MTETQNESTYDVVIVGSGPAGASTAKALTEHGLKTIIVEKAKLPRYKMCSGILAPASVKFVADHFGQIPANAIAAPSDVIGVRLYPTIGSPVVELPILMGGSGAGLPELGMNIRRPEFDYWLCTCSDAEVIDQCRFKGMDKRDAEIVVTLEHNGQDRKISAR